MSRSQVCLCTLLLALAAACSARDGHDGSGQDAPSSEGDPSLGDDADADVDAEDDDYASEAGVILEASIPEDSAWTSSEVCDGVDNDNNGIIDDVDVGGDGVCDCLSIATLGKPGGWGKGDVFKGWLESRSSRGALELGAMVLTEELLKGVQVVVVEDVRTRSYSEAEAGALESWVRNGGGLMTLTGFADPSERANTNLLLRSAGISYDATPIGGLVDTWLQHPVSQGVHSARVVNGYAVLGGTPIAKGSVTFLAGAELGSGHVLAWGDEWITYDSEWTGHPEFQIERLWLNILQWFSPRNECRVPILL